MTMNDESRASVKQPIIVGMAKTVQQLAENQDLARRLTELVFGKLAADQLAARDEVIEELVESLDSAVRLIDDSQYDLASFRAALAKARGEA